MKARIPAAQAQETAQWAIGLLADCCTSIEIAGSLRRGKATVGDIELVAQEKAPAALKHRLEYLLHIDKTIRKARYDNGKYRWEGTKYYGFTPADQPDIKLEVFLCQPDNWGYITWLRTGPGDANTIVMKHLSFKQWNVRFKDGLAWHVMYDGRMPVYINQLAVPDEGTLFRLIGIPYIDPADRTGRYLQNALKYQQRPDSRWLESLYVAATAPETTKPVQQSLF